MVYLPSIPDPYTLELKNVQLSQDGIYRNMLLDSATLYCSVRLPLNSIKISFSSNIDVAGNSLNAPSNPTSSINNLYRIHPLVVIKRNICCFLITILFTVTDYPILFQPSLKFRNSKKLSSS